MLSAAELDRVRERLGTNRPLSARPLHGGRSNVTLALHEGDDDAPRWVLRTPPKAGLTPSAHDVAREFRVTSALVDTPVPVPAPVVLVEDDDDLGRPYAVWQFVPGRSLQSARDLDDLDDTELDAVVTHLIDALGALHSVDHRDVGLTAPRSPRPYATRQVRRWTRQWTHVALGDDALRRDVETLSARLNDAAASLPAQRDTAIVHGDYRIDNALVLLRPAPRVGAIVDWELSTIGDPVADVALMCTYRDPALDLIIGTPTAWTSDRIPDAAGLAARYVAATSRVLEHWELHLAVGHFKLAVIAAGIEQRRRAGATPGPGFDTAVEAVPLLISRGLEILRSWRPSHPSAAVPSADRT